jgi:hypothetical protein
VSDVSGIRQRDGFADQIDGRIQGPIPPRPIRLCLTKTDLGQPRIVVQQVRERLRLVGQGRQISDVPAFEASHPQFEIYIQLQ